MGEGNMANIINAILTATSLCIMLTGMWMDTLSLLGTSFAFFRCRFILLLL